MCVAAVLTTFCEIDEDLDRESANWKLMRLSSCAITPVLGGIPGFTIPSLCSFEVGSLGSPSPCRLLSLYLLLVYVWGLPFPPFKDGERVSSL